MSFFKNLVFDITFVDPMSTLAIFLLWLHYYMLFFICLVLIFVSFIIIKLVNNYNWTVFQRTPFYFDLWYKLDFIVTLNHLFYSYFYSFWLRFCKLFLIFFRLTYLKIRTQKNQYPHKMSFWFTALSRPNFFSINSIKATTSLNLDKYISKSSVLFNTIPVWVSKLLNFSSNKKEIKEIYNYSLNDKKNFSRDVFYYNYMSNLLHNFSCYGYFNSKVRLHLKKYSEFFHMYFWRSNLIFELQLAFIPFLIAIFLIVPSVIVTSFITDPERGRDFDENSPSNWIDSTVDVIGHQWFWKYRFLNTISGSSVNFSNIHNRESSWNLSSTDASYIQHLQLTYPLTSLKQKPTVQRFTIDSSNLSVLSEEDFANHKKRLVNVDKKLFLKPGSRTKFLITSADVIHAFSLPSLGVKLDAVPYRLSYQVPRIRNYEAIIYGFCSELCGVQHAQMPIEAVVTDVVNDFII